MKSKIAFHAWDNQEQRARFFDVGEDVPDHIADRLGDHAVDRDGGEPEPEPEPEPEGGDAEETETADPNTDTAFDPAKASAKEVSDYLKSLTDTDAGNIERDRVVAAEKAAHNDGEGRVTALS